LPQGLNALKQVAKQVGLDLRGASLNLDGGFDSAHHRQCIFNAGLIPNITENPRNRKTPKRGRKRFFNEAIHALRMRVERTFAWEDTFKRLLLRFERIQQWHYGMKLMAYTLINLRTFCGIENSQPVMTKPALRWHNPQHLPALFSPLRHHIVPPAPCS
jgi:transposase